MIQQPTFWDQAGEIHVDGGAGHAIVMATPARSFTNTRALAYETSEKFRRSTAAIVFKFIRDRGEHGAIDEEIEEEIEELVEGLGKRGSTGRCRRVDLARGGRIRDSGRRRPTRTGHDAIVWIATGTTLD